MIAHGRQWIRVVRARGGGSSVEKGQRGRTCRGGEHGGYRCSERGSRRTGTLTLAWAGVDGRCKRAGSTQSWASTAPMGQIVEVGRLGKLVFKFSISNQADPNCKIWKEYFHSSKNFQTLKGDR
jgi:hypothetical protein